MYRRCGKLAHAAHTVVPPADFATRCLRSILCSSLILIALTSVAQRAVCQSVKFGPAITYPTGSRAYALASGDFNDDGKIDLAVASVESNSISVLFGKGDGTFQTPVNYALGVSPYYIIAGDFNGDGKLDLVTANPYAGNISVLIGKGDGTFGTPVNYAVGKFPGHIITGDFNRDGKIDLAMTGGNSDVIVLLGNGNGTFQSAVSYSVDKVPTTLAVGDFNGDGKIDLITGNGGSNSVSVLLGNGDGTFQKPINSNSGSGSTSIVVGDFDRDGKLDVALGDSFLKILKGNGDGTFKPPSFDYRLHNTSVDMKAGDFNGDGKVDLVSAGVFQGGNVQVLLGNGDGTFQDAGDLIDSVAALSVLIADFNGDTRPDLAVAINGQLSVALLNATPGKPDNTQYFVHQHYLDFLDREPDDRGFDYWTQNIDQCANDPLCIRNRRTDISAAFFIETEFQQSGYFPYRLYKASFGRRPTYAEFTLDRHKVVGGADLEASKTALAKAFTQREQFKQAYPDSLSNADFVNKLFDSAGLVPFTSERQAAIASLDKGADRASVLQNMVENSTFKQREYNSAFVQMQYFGYLRRDEDVRGYNFWLDVLNNKVPGNFRSMVCAFITSTEYQQRFGSAVTHSNAECGS